MARRLPDHGVGSDGTSNVLEVLLAQISELYPDLASDLIVGRRRDAYAARLRDALKPSRDVNAIPKDVGGSTITSPILIPTRKAMRVSSNSSIVISLIRVWNCTGPADRFDRAWKLCQNPSPVFLTMRPRCSAIAGWTASVKREVSLAMCVLFVAMHEPRIANHVGGQEPLTCAQPGLAAPAPWRNSKPPLFYNGCNDCPSVCAAFCPKAKYPASRPLFGAKQTSAGP